jgi:hypothetical protein
MSPCAAARASPRTAPHPSPRFSKRGTRGGLDVSPPENFPGSGCKSLSCEGERRPLTALVPRPPPWILLSGPRRCDRRLPCGRSARGCAGDPAVPIIENPQCACRSAPDGGRDPPGTALAQHRSARSGAPLLAALGPKAAGAIVPPATKAKVRDTAARTLAAQGRRSCRRGRGRRVGSAPARGRPGARRLPPRSSRSSRSTRCRDL